MSSDLMTKILDSEQQFIKVFAPLLPSKGRNRFFFPSEINDPIDAQGPRNSPSIEDTDWDFLSFLFDDDLILPQPDEEALLPRFFRSVEAVRFSDYQSTCPVCFSELGRQTECSTCGTPNDNKKLKLRFSVRPYCLGNKSAQIMHKWEKIELYKLLRSIQPTGITKKEWNEGIILYYNNQSYIIIHNSQWYLYKQTQKLRQTKSHFTLIQSLWNIWRKDVFKQ